MDCIYFVTDKISQFNFIAIFCMSSLASSNLSISEVRIDLPLALFGFVCIPLVSFGKFLLSASFIFIY